MKNIHFFLLFFSFFVSLTHACQSRGAISSPVLEFRPLAPDRSNLIWYKRSDKRNTLYWVDELNKFLEPYLQRQKSENVIDCSNGKKHPKNRVCDFKIDHRFVPCDREHGYGFELDNGGPCIFLKLGRIPKSWNPRFYTTSNLPNDIPLMLKNHIQSSHNYNYMTPKVWISCEGDTPSDEENMGPIVYIPEMGFDGKYLVNTDVEGYLSPLVAVYFENPTRGVLISVICKAWASNILRDPENSMGTVRVELLID